MLDTSEAIIDRKRRARRITTSLRKLYPDAGCALNFNTPFELVEEYYEALEAPKKELVWFEESAHYMIFAEPEKLAEELIAMKNEVLRK